MFTSASVGIQSVSRSEEISWPRGKYEGYLPVWQDDSAGPHIEENFLAFLRENFEREGLVMDP